MSQPIDKFKVDETAPFFPIGPMAPTGSYGNFSSGLKNEYVLKFKDNQTKSVIRTSGLLSNNAKNSLPVFVSLTNFGSNWVESTNDPETWASVSSSASGQYQKCCYT